MKNTRIPQFKLSVFLFNKGLKMTWSWLLSISRFLENVLIGLLSWFWNCIWTNYIHHSDWRDLIIESVLGMLMLNQSFVDKVLVFIAPFLKIVGFTLYRYIHQINLTPSLFLDAVLFQSFDPCNLPSKCVFSSSSLFTLLTFETLNLIIILINNIRNKTCNKNNLRDEPFSPTIWRPWLTCEVLVNHSRPGKFLIKR